MNRYFRILVCALTIGISVGQLFAQNNGTLRLQDCLNLAMRNNTQLKNATYRLDQSAASVKSSYSAVLPRISSTFGSSRFVQSDRTILDDVPVAFDSTTGQTVFEQREITQEGSSRNSHSAQISYNQTLWDFGRNYNRINQAKASFESSSQALVSARYAVYSTVKQRYFELLKAVNLERELQEAVERSEGQYNRTQSMYEIGSVALVDVYRAESSLGRDKIIRILQKTVVQIARGNLNIALGRDPETPIEIAEVDVEAETINVSLDEAIRISEVNNPDLKRFESDMQSSDYGRKVAKGAYWPSFGVNISYSRSSPEINNVYGGLDKNFNVSFGAQMSFNLFNGFADVAELQRQTSNYSIAKENWLGTRRQTSLNVKQAFLDLQAQKEISKINENNVRASEEEFRLARERYRVGAGTQLDVTVAQQSLTSAKVTLVRAKYDAMIARARLETAMGIVGTENEN